MRDKELLVIVPSRGRPEVIASLAEAFFETSAGYADLLIGLDDDDVEYPRVDYYPVMYEVNPRLRLGGTLNLLAKKYCWKYKYLGFMGDDHRPRTANWDQRFVESLENLQTGLVYGDDLIWGEGLPTEVAMTSNIVQKLGYMVPPGMIHLYLDNFWLELGKKVGIRYRPDVVIEHLHPSVGKAEWTPEYQAVNAPEVYDYDRAKFEEYCSHQFEKDVAKLLESD